MLLAAPGIVLRARILLRSEESPAAFPSGVNVREHG